MCKLLSYFNEMKCNPSGMNGCLCKYITIFWKYSELKHVCKKNSCMRRIWSHNLSESIHVAYMSFYSLLWALLSYSRTALVAWIMDYRSVWILPSCLNVIYSAFIPLIQIPVQIFLQFVAYKTVNKPLCFVRLLQIQFRIIHYICSDGFDQIFDLQKIDKRII